MAEHVRHLVDMQDKPRSFLPDNDFKFDYNLQLWKKAKLRK